MKFIVILAFLIMASRMEEIYDRAKHQAMVDLVNSLDTTWKARVHERFVDKSESEIKCFLGALRTPPHLLLEPKTFDNSIDPPPAFDSRTAWDKCESIKEVRDQSACGSCWAFGAVEAMSDRICVASGQTKQTRLSATDMLACCGFCGFGCEGGYPSSAWSFWKSTGLVTGNLYGDKKNCLPYPFPPCSHHMTPKTYPACPKELYPTPDCDQKCQDGYPIPYAKDKIKSKSSYSVYGEENIKKDIMTNGPVECTMTVYADFLDYKGGVYKHVTGGYLGGHAMKMLGWGVEGTTPYWIVINSWNEEWGDHGQIRILRGKNECGIESGITAGLP